MPEPKYLIIGHTTLIKYPTQIKNMINCHKVVCGCRIFISESIIHYELNAWILQHILKSISASEISYTNISDLYRRKNLDSI